MEQKRDWEILQFEIPDYIVVLQHPLSSEISSAYEQMSGYNQGCKRLAREKNNFM